MNKDFANKLCNLPKKHRDWVIKNVAPETLIRWFKQNGFKTKIKNLVEGKEELSDLAKLEKKKDE
jgi:hypothetical protein